MKDSLKQAGALRDLAEAKETCWINPGLRPFEEVKDSLAFHSADTQDAAKRLRRFSPLLMRISDTGVLSRKPELTA